MRVRVMGRRLAGDRWWIWGGGGDWSMCSEKQFKQRQKLGERNSGFGKV
jgi:hypothetical protein